MGKRWDAVTFGRSRRSRRMMRKLRELDRTDARARAAGKDPLEEWLRSREQPRVQQANVKVRARRPRNGVRNVVFVALFLAASIGTTALIRHPGAPMTTAGRPAGLPPAGHEEHDRPLGRPVKAPAGSGGFAYEVTQADGHTPATWDPCRPIHYVTTGTAPAGAHSLLTSALARVSEVTGFQFIDDGHTDEFPLPNRPAYQPDRYGARWAPVLVAWADPQQVPELAGNVIGLGGGTPVTARTGNRTIVSGILFLDAPQFAHDLAAAGAAQRSEEVRRQLRAVVLHEAGHLLGLAHVADPKQIMYPEAGLQVVDYGPGDLRGLNRLASGACAPDL